MNAKSRFSFKAYLKEGTSAPVVSERYTGNPWVYFGADNLFLENMRTLADNCVPLQRCVEMAAMFIAGKGIKFKDQEGNEIPAAQAKFQEWMKDTTEEEFLYATALDIALANAKSWVLRRGFGGALVRVDHLDVVRLRSGKLTDGKITDYYWSSDWNKIGPRGGSVEDRYRPITLPAFTTERKEAKSVMYSKTYKQNRDYYGEPWYLAAVQDCEVWAKVPNFNKVQIDTGFRPSVHLHTFINADTKDLEQYDKDIENAYTGSNGRGFFHTFGMPEEGAPILTPLERGDHAGELDTIRDNAEKVIVRAYGIPDILYRMDTSGGLSSQGSALKAALEQFQTTFVEPKQQIICRDLVKLMNEEGIEVWEAEIEGLEVFEEEGQTEKVILSSMTVNEIRDEMDLPPLEDERGDKIPAMAAPAATPPRSAPPQAKPNMDAPEDTPNPEDE